MPVPGQHKTAPDGTVLMGADGLPLLNTGRWTPQRLEVLADLMAGWSYTEMADRQHRSVDTVKKHCANLYSEFGVSSRVEAVMLWL